MHLTSIRFIAAAPLALAAALAVTPVGAATVTFDSFNNEFFGDNDAGNGLVVATSEGFNFTSSADHFHLGDDLVGNPGTTGALLNDITDAIITMTAGSGASFDLLSAGLAAVTLTNTPFVTVTGYFSGGGSIASAVPVTTALGTAELVGFTGLSSVTFQGTGGNSLGNQFWIDDLTVQVVPLPPAAGLLVTALAAMGIYRQSRRN